jgi:hypothetical protein
MRLGSDIDPVNPLANPLMTSSGNPNSTGNNELS